MQKMQELEEENRQMRERYQAMQMQVSELMRERSNLAAELEKAAHGMAVAPPPPSAVHDRDSHQFKELKAIVKKKTEELKMYRQYVVANGLQLPNTGGGVELVAED